MSSPHARSRWFEALLVALPLLLVVAAIQPPGPARANGCLWDSDTLRTEAAGLPGVAEIITGRFDRFPPEYYEARLARVSAKIGNGETSFEDFDDAAVACDRLGRGDEAIEWMARKRDVLESMEAADSRSDESDAMLKEARYRYLANLGTFHAHRWLRDGADRDNLADLERAEELIAAAIELNPEAHFGRERYQRMAIEWLLDPPDWDEGLPPTFFRANSVRVPKFQGYWYDAQALAPAGYGDAIEGLTGLIALGGAWESVDAFLTLAAALDDRADASLAHLARLRAKELIGLGANSLHPAHAMVRADLEGHEVSSVMETAEIETWYDAARAEAEAWRASRSEYALSKLAEGSHPDTDPEFWSAWVEPSSPPAMPNGFLGRAGNAKYGLQISIALGVIGVVLLAGAVGIVLIVRRWFRLRAAQTA